jgi:cell division protein FtsB
VSEKLRDSRGWQLLIITSLILVVPLMADINGRIGILRRMHQQEARLNQELTQAQAEREALKARLQFVSGDEYLEQWARVEARMTQPGEVAIIPLYPESTQSETSASTTDSSPTDTSPSTSEQWHRLFFDAATNP